MAAERGRFSGKVDDLANSVDEYIVHPHSLAYDDKYDTARVQPTLILKMGKMWADVRKLQPNLCFTATTAAAGFEIIAQRRGEKWLKAADRPDWVKTMQNRFQLELRGATKPD